MLMEIFKKEDRSKLGLVQTFSFVQYNDKFCDVGSFSMKVPLTEPSLPHLIRGNYLLFEPFVLGIIRKKTNETEESISITIEGSLLNIILSYRSFLKTTKYTDTLTDVSRQMVRDLLMYNEDSRRNISYISLSSEGRYTPESPKISAQFTGKKLSTALNAILQPSSYGYELVPILTRYTQNPDNPTNIESFEFRVLKPVNRTIGNPNGNTPVVFSFELNNLSRFVYGEDDSDYCSTAIVAGEGEGVNRTIIEAGDLEASGIDRVELYVDARDLQSTDSNGNSVSAEDYTDILIQRGNENLLEHQSFVSISGTVISGDKRYIYGVDFYKGDFVTVMDDQHRIVVNAQVTEVTKSLTSSGEVLDLTFGYEKATVRELIRKRGIV